MTSISNTDDTIDIREVIERVEELREELNVEHDDAEANEVLDMRAELTTLESLLEECKGNGGDEQWEGDWYPVTLIHDSHFVDAMRELCEDIGDFPNGVPSYYVIDWEATAENLRGDYTSIDFDGQTYWTR